MVNVGRPMKLLGALLAMWFVFASSTGMAANQPKDLCSSMCSAAADCSAQCFLEAGPDQPYGLSTCGEWGGVDAWEGGYCAPPPDPTLWDNYVAPLMSSPSIAPIEDEGTAELWSTALYEAMDAANGGTPVQNGIAFLSVLHNYGLYPDDPSSYGSAPVAEITADGDVMSGPSDRDVALGIEAQPGSCSEKWQKVGRGGLVLAGLGAVGVVANAGAFFFPVLVPAVGYVNVGLAGLASNVAASMLYDAAQQCNRAI